MKKTSLRLVVAVVMALILTPGVPLAAQDAKPAAAQLRLTSIDVQPDDPGADTLCKLTVTVHNDGDRQASQLGFAVTLNGQDLSVYGNQLFMYPVAPGATEEISLYNFWTTETSRAMPADGKLRVEVTLKEAVWTRVEMETDEEGEIEVWTPIGPVENLPVSAAVTLQMKTGG